MEHRLSPYPGGGKRRRPGCGIAELLVMDQSSTSPEDEIGATQQPVLPQAGLKIQHKKLHAADAR
jgi:hypothetical protein